MASDGGDPIARRRRIAERGSDRLALITGGRAPKLPSSSSSSYNASSPPSDENSGGSKSGSTKGEASGNERPSSSNKSINSPKSELKIYLYKTVSPNQLRPAILASQETRRKCSFFAGIVALLSHIGFPILGSYIIRSIILSRPLFLLLLINVTITIGPLFLDAMKLIQQEANSGASSSSDADFPGSPFEWGMLFKTGVSAFFMDSCIYSVVVVCGMSILQKYGL